MPMFYLYIYIYIYVCIYFWTNSFSIPFNKSGSNYDNFTSLSWVYKGHINSFESFAIFASLITLGLRKKMQMHVVYTAFSRAFDSVSHNLLIHKLNLIGCCGFSII